MAKSFSKDNGSIEVNAPHSNNGPRAACNCHEAEDEEAKKLEVLANAYKAILLCCGEDIHREGIVKTPMRAAKAMRYLTSGMRTDVHEVVNGAIFHEEGADGLVVVRDIDFSSLCEHHLVPFKGQAHIGYVANGAVLGLSKFARIVNVFARRLQVQERLTKQIAQAIEDELAPLGVAVVIQSEHLCMVMRGVEKVGSSTVTSSFLGQFKSDADLRQQFFNQISFSSFK